MCESGSDAEEQSDCFMTRFGKLRFLSIIQPLEADRLCLRVAFEIQWILAQHSNELWHRQECCLPSPSQGRSMRVALKGVCSSCQCAKKLVRRALVS